MYGKILLYVVSAFLLLVFYSSLCGTVDLKSYFFPSAQRLDLPPGDVVDHCPGRTPLKVYMYDLPRKFHVGMMDRRSPEDAPVTAENLPRWPRNSGLRKQHSVEYWLMASLLYDGGDGEVREAVRVFDPAIADAFFVPFFSSLSFNTHGHSMKDPETEIDRRLQIDLIKMLKKSNYWKRSWGRDHVIPMTHPNAFRFLRQQVNASILIVADFGRSPKSMSSLRKDVVAPYVHVVDSFRADNVSDPFDSRKTLLFFRGNTIRKDGGRVRSRLAKVLVGHGDVLFERSSASTEAIHASTQGMRSSKFCLHPAGDTPSSCRLFDAIVSNCVPVIVSDRIELPFEDELDYSKFCLFFSVTDAVRPGYLVNKLRHFSKAQWTTMWRELKLISHHFEFQYPPRKEDAVDMIWRQVRHKLPTVNLSLHRSHRLKVPDWWDP